MLSENMLNRIGHDGFYHFTYSVINIINWKIYYGVHNTKKLFDNYFGSGKILKRALKKYGRENFLFEIDKFFNSSIEAFKYESKIVNEEFVKRNDTYNVAFGGKGGRIFLKKGEIFVKNINNETIVINSSEYDREIHKSKFLDSIPAIDNNGNKIYCDTKDLKSGEYKHIWKNKIPVKLTIDSKEIFWVDKNDEKWINGTYFHMNAGMNVGKKVSIETRKNLSKASKGRITIYKNNSEKNIYQHELDKYLKLGWKKGRVKRRWITNIVTNKSKMVLIEEVEKYIANGWKFGRIYQQKK